MKKVIIISLVFLSFIFYLYFRSGSNVKPQPQNNIILSTVIPTKNNPWPYQIAFSYNNQNLILNYIEIPQSAQMSLIPNFSEKENGETIVKNYQCDAAVNGGFYMENDRPLGLFISDGKKYGEKTISNIAHAFFWQEKNRKRSFGKNPPDLNSLDFILQTGPLIFPGDYQLKMMRDENARRMLISTDDNNGLYLITVFAEDNNFSGPLLSDLPKIFNEKEVKQKLPLTLLLNLDGGSASFFFAKENIMSFALLELTPIGSLICVKS